MKWHFVRRSNTPEPRKRTFSKEKSTYIGELDSRISEQFLKAEKLSPADAQVCEPFHLHSLVAICRH